MKNRKFDDDAWKLLLVIYSTCIVIAWLLVYGTI